MNGPRLSGTITAPARSEGDPVDPSRRPLRVAIVGAGVSGIVTARALRTVGCAVTIFEGAPDSGGVWSATRTYPGIATQDDRRSYAFSDLAMPDDVAEHPSGAAVRSYLDSYLRRAGLEVCLRLSTTVTKADLDEDLMWRLETDGPDGVKTDTFDWLVAANGAFSTPHVPRWPGRERFEAAGGRVVTPGALADGSALEGARTVVVGWGKTACDVAVAAAARSASVTVVARRLMWKYPKRFGMKGVTFRHVLLTRAGERLTHGALRSGAGRVLLHRLPEHVLRLLIGRAIARTIDRASGLSALGLRPRLDFRASNSLVTEGFFDRVRDASIRVHRDRTVERLDVDEGGPCVLLSDGERVPADVVVAATGYEQGLPFITDAVIGRARNHGALLLHRRTLAVDLPRLAVVGWAHSYRSPLTSEIAAVWLAGVVTGRVVLPTHAEQQQRADRFLLARADSAGGGTSALPGVSMGELDRMLEELGSPLPARIRLRQIWRPIDPADYRRALAEALRSSAVAASVAGPTDGTAARERRAERSAS